MSKAKLLFNLSSFWKRTWNDSFQFLINNPWETPAAQEGRVEKMLFLPQINWSLTAVLPPMLWCLLELITVKGRQKVTLDIQPPHPADPPLLLQNIRRSRKSDEELWPGVFSREHNPICGFVILLLRKLGELVGPSRWRTQDGWHLRWSWVFSLFLFPLAKMLTRVNSTTLQIYADFPKYF